MSPWSISSPACSVMMTYRPLAIRSVLVPRYMLLSAQMDVQVTDNSKQVDPSMTAVNNKHKWCATIPHFDRQPHLDGSLFFSWRIQHTQQVVPSTSDTDFLHRCSIMICVKCPGCITQKYSVSRRIDARSASTFGVKMHTSSDRKHNWIT